MINYYNKLGCALRGSLGILGMNRISRFQNSVCLELFGENSLSWLGETPSVHKTVASF